MTSSDPVYRAKAVPQEFAVTFAALLLRNSDERDRRKMGMPDT